MALSHVEALQILAFHAVTRGGLEYQIRRIARWYSERYHVPLPEALELPTDHLFETYFEVKYEEMDGGVLEQERLRLTAKPDTSSKPKLTEDEQRAADDEEFARIAEAMAATQAAPPKIGAELPKAPPPISMSFEDKET